MLSLFEDVKSYFIEEKWAFQEHGSLNVLRIPFDGSDGEWVVLVRVLDDLEIFIFLSIYPEPVPEDRRQIVANLIAHENYHLDIGAFEMNMQQGELRLRTSVDVSGTEVTHGLIHNAYHTNILTMNDYYDPLRKVINGEWGIKQATEYLRALEDDDDEDDDDE